MPATRRVSPPHWQARGNSPTMARMRPPSRKPKFQLHLLFPTPVQGWQNGLKISGRRFAKGEVEDVEGLFKNPRRTAG